MVHIHPNLILHLGSVAPKVQTGQPVNDLDCLLYTRIGSKFMGKIWCLLVQLGGVWKQSIFKVLRQNHGIEEYRGIFIREVFG
jgi:hypothetical protein